MGNPFSLAERLPNGGTDLNVLNLGAGKCASPISNVIPTIKFRMLVNVEVWPPDFYKLDAMKFQAQFITNLKANVVEYVEEPFARWEFDVVLLIDVLEHFNSVVAKRVLERCRYIGKRVVIFLPIGVCPQDALDGNPFQQHLSTWQVEDFQDASVEYFPKFHMHFNPPVDAAWVIYDPD